MIDSTFENVCRRGGHAQGGSGEGQAGPSSGHTAQPAEHLLLLARQLVQPLLTQLPGALKRQQVGAESKWEPTSCANP
jgi:hypothetical protein